MAFRLRFWKVDPDGALGLIVRLFSDTFRRYLAGYAVAVFFMILVAAMLALTAWIMSDIVNQVFIDKRVDQLMFLAGAVVVISVLRGIGMYGSTVAMARIGNSIVARTQKRIFDHLLALGIDFYNRTPSSDLITRISYNANSARIMINTVLTGVVRDFLSVIGLLAVMLVQSPEMSLVALLVGPAAILGVNRLIRRIRDVARMEIASLSKVIGAMQETARGIRIVKAFNLEGAMRARMGAAIDDVRERANKIAGIQARTGPIMETLGGLAIAGVIVWAGFATIYYDAPPGNFLSFITAILLAYEPAKRLANTRVQIETSVVSLRILYRLLDTPTTMTANEDGPELRVTGGEVAFKNVSFAYRKGKAVFFKLNFRAAPGKVTALVGPSGAGKSSIISLIERFHDVARGVIEIDGQDIAKVRLASLRRQISLVSQDVVLFDATLRENIRFGREDATDAEVEEAAKNAMAHDFIMATKNGYDTEIDDGGMQLSGGQRQRLAIARAMLRRAPIVLLDEATSSLDSESEHQVQVAFDRLTAGRTTIVIAHRLSTVLGADRICVLVDGKLVEEGRHAELMAADKHYARLYRLQFEKLAGGKGDDGEPEEPAEGEPAMASDLATATRPRRASGRTRTGAT